MDANCRRLLIAGAVVQTLCGDAGGEFDPERVGGTESTDLAVGISVNASLKLDWAPILPTTQGGRQAENNSRRSVQAPRELDAAEFFIRGAIELADRHYPDAEHDLRLILYYKASRNRP